MIIETLSTFPHMFDSVMGSSMMKIAQDKGLLDFTSYDLRDWTHDRHRTTDDDPYGGGLGLVMKCEPIYEAYQAITGIDAGYEVPSPTGNEQPLTGPRPRHACAPAPKTIFLTPCGVQFDDQLACTLSKHERLLFVCGHYEGIDERVLEEIVDEEISIGDYVLTGGELPAIIVADCVCRMIPGVLSGEDSFTKESHYASLLEEPQYTRPEVWHDKSVPEVLLSGHHANIEVWRRQQQLERTRQKRPDLLERAALDKKDKEYLKKLTEEEQSE
jgi:tRNA (guanine37-N1)-methyltransferase